MGGGVWWWMGVVVEESKVEWVIVSYEALEGWKVGEGQKGGRLVVEVKEGMVDDGGRNGG